MKKILGLLALMLGCTVYTMAQTAPAPATHKMVTPMPAHTTGQKTTTVKTAAPATKTVAKPATQTNTTPAMAKPTTGTKMKADGTPDKRYKTNAHLKKDGTPDKRYSKTKN